MKRLFACTIMLLATAPTFAADANGYTAQYECRAGGPHCNVDVITLSTQPCEQTITPNTPPTGSWEAVDWARNVICIEAGDHTSRGILTFQSSGTASRYKVIRYYRLNDSNDEPWNQSITNRARIIGFHTNGKNNWLIHRLTVEGTPTPNQFNGEQNILNRTLIQNTQNHAVEMNESRRNTVQNGVIRNTVKVPTVDNACINLGWAIEASIVNQEHYGCTDGVVGTQGAPNAEGTVIENSDFWVPADYLSGSRYSCVENAIDIKSGGTAARPLQILNNRAWGFKETDTSCGGTGDAGAAMQVHCPSCQSANYVLFRNNIIADSYAGIATPNTGTQHHSLIANLIYNIANPVNSGWQYPLHTAKASRSEIYLNTVVLANSTFAGGESDEVMCNAFITAGSQPGSFSGSGNADYNAYYDTAAAVEGHSVSRSISTRTNGTSYAVGQILRTSSAANCRSAQDTACFLYMVTSAGTTAASMPSYCTTLGCTVSDGSMTVQAIRGPYTYRRKLRTVAGGEPAIVPYAKLYVAGPESGKCPISLGSRAGVGIGDAPMFQ